MEVEVQDRPLNLIPYADEEKQEQKWQLNANCGRITSYAANQLHKIRRHSKLKQPHSIQPHQLILTQYYLPLKRLGKKIKGFGILCKAVLKTYPVKSRLDGSRLAQLAGRPHKLTNRVC